MGLSERIRQRAEGAAPSAQPGAPGVDGQVFNELKSQLHQSVIRRLDLKSLEKLSLETLQSQLREVIAPMLVDTNAPLNQFERDRMVQELLDELTGLGPLEPLLRDGTISDILVNTYSTVYVERAGKLELTPVRFADNAHLLRDHRPHRLAGGPARRRVSPDGGRPAARRRPRQRHHPSPGHRRPCPVHPALRREPSAGATTWWRIGSLDEQCLDFLEACVRGAAQHPHQRRHRHRQDHHAERAVRLHPGRRAHRHHRGLGRAAAPAAPRGAARDPPGQHRGRGRDHASATW